MNEELPQIQNCSYASNTLTVGWAGDSAGLEYQQGGQQHYNYPPGTSQSASEVVFRMADLFNSDRDSKVYKAKIVEEPMSDIALRLVRVFIVDPDQNVPVEKRLLFSDERLTDLTDQELFFEYGIKEILSKHNEYRATILDDEQTKAQSKNVYLESIRVRDLKMIVVDVFKVPAKK